MRAGLLEILHFTDQPQSRLGHLIIITIYLELKWTGKIINSRFKNDKKILKHFIKRLKTSNKQSKAQHVLDLYFVLASAKQIKKRLISVELPLFAISHRGFMTIEY